MIKITGVRHAYPEKPGFVIDRKRGHGDYTFLHFITPIRMTVEGELRDLPAHAVMLYAPGTPQFFCSDAFVVHDWMHLSGDLAPLLTANGIETDKLYFPAATDFITAILRELEAEFFGETAGKEKLMALKLEELFLKLGRALSADGGAAVDKVTRDRLRSLRGRIFSSVEKRWTVGEMAELLHLSASRFQVVYKSVFGVSPMRDLIGARIDEAKKMLSSTALSVSAVAEAVGYDSVCHFIRQFKDITGLSPSTYRGSVTDAKRK